MNFVSEYFIYRKPIHAHLDVLFSNVTVLVPIDSR